MPEGFQGGTAPFPYLIFSSFSLEYAIREYSNNEYHVRNAECIIMPSITRLPDLSTFIKTSRVSLAPGCSWMLYTLYKSNERSHLIVSCTFCICRPRERFYYKLNVTQRHRSLGRFFFTFSAGQYWTFAAYFRLAEVFPTDFGVNFFSVTTAKFYFWSPRYHTKLLCKHFFRRRRPNSANFW